MSTIDESFVTWQTELFADPNIAALEREQRHHTFSQLYTTLDVLNPDKHPALFFDTYSPDNEQRKVLIIDQLHGDRNKASARVLVSDERLTPENLTRREQVGNCFQLRRAGNLIMHNVCRVPRIDDGTWYVGDQGFYLQKPVENPTTFIRHGIGFKAFSMRDTSRTTPEKLANRRIAAENLLGILTQLISVSPVATSYLFTAEAS